MKLTENGSTDTGKDYLFKDTWKLPSALQCFIPASLLVVKVVVVVVAAVWNNSTFTKWILLLASNPTPTLSLYKRFNMIKGFWKSYYITFNKLSGAASFLKRCAVLAQWSNGTRQLVLELTDVAPERVCRCRLQSTRAAAGCSLSNFLEKNE